jgi:hypothetical protein
MSIDDGVGMPAGKPSVRGSPDRLRANPGPRNAAQDPVLRWLLDPAQPAVRYRALRDLLDRPETDPDVVEARDRIPNVGWAAQLFARQKPGGHWESAEDLYQPKYASTIWNTQVLADLGVTRAHPPMAAACELFLAQYARTDGGFDNPPEEPGRSSELCATGNLARTLFQAGYGSDPRVRSAMQWVVEHQKSDGGWHCWRPVHVGRGTLDCWEGLSALASIPVSQRSPAVRRAIERGAEFYLRHRLVDQGRPPYAAWRRFHFPAHYYYDALVGLDVLTSLGYGADPRLDKALALLESKRGKDGRWTIERQHPDIGPGAGYRPRRRGRPLVVEPSGRPSRWLTLTASRVLRRVATARARPR